MSDQLVEKIFNTSNATELVAFLPRAGHEVPRRHQPALAWRGQCQRLGIDPQALVASRAEEALEDVAYTLGVDQAISLIIAQGVILLSDFLQFKLKEVEELYNECDIKFPGRDPETDNFLGEWVVAQKYPLSTKKYRFIWPVRFPGEKFQLGAWGFFGRKMRASS